MIYHDKSRSNLKSNNYHLQHNIGIIEPLLDVSYPKMKININTFKEN